MAVQPGKRKSSSFQEKDYLKLAGQRARRASDFDFFPKFLIYARKKKGKTTFALTAGEPDEVLILDPEEGAVYKRSKYNPFIWPIDRWEDVDEAYGALRTGKLSPNHIKQGESSTPFRWCVPDGLTRINNMALRFVMKRAEETNLDRQPGMVDRRDYNKSGELMKQMLTQFHTLKMGVIYTAQERMWTGSSGDEDDSDDGDVFFVPDLPQGVRGHVNSLVDVIGRLYTVKVNEQVVRRLQIGVHEKYDTGARSEFELPDVLKSPTIPKLVKLMEEGAPTKKPSTKATKKRSD